MMVTGLSAEASFLLTRLVGAENSTYQTNHLNWQSILKIADRNGLIPLLYHSLSSGVDVPVNVFNELRLRATRISARNAVLTRELTGIMRLFEENDIPVIPYKGPVLAQRLYGDVTLRDFDDLDLLILEKDIRKAKELILAEGYRPKNALYGLTMEQERAFLGFHYTYDFIVHNPNHQLEIHWGIVPKTFSLSLDYEGIWKRCIRIPWQHGTVLAFCPEDLLFTLCISGAKKVWDRALRVLDVARTLSIYPEIKWDVLLNRAREAGAERILFLGIELASTLFDVSPPSSVSQLISRDKTIPRLSQSIIKKILSEGSQTGFVAPEDQFQPLHLKVRERWTDRLRYCFRVTFTPSVGEWNAVRLPGSLYFLYHVIRPVRLIWKAVRRAPQLFVRKAD